MQHVSNPVQYDYNYDPKMCNLNLTIFGQNLILAFSITYGVKNFIRCKPRNKKTIYSNKLTFNKLITN